MNILKKINNYLNEEKIPKGLLNWVKDYQKYRKTGNVKAAKEIKSNIDIEIKKLKLNKKKVYMYFGDPDIK